MNIILYQEYVDCLFLDFNAGSIMNMPVIIIERGLRSFLLEWFNSFIQFYCYSNFYKAIVY